MALDESLGGPGEITPNEGVQLLADLAECSCDVHRLVLYFGDLPSQLTDPRVTVIKINSIVGQEKLKGSFSVGHSLANVLLDPELLEHALNCRALATGDGQSIAFDLDLTESVRR